jgi:acyl-coenzyme A synthetase/AMP-(fatty) acid ligase
MTDNLKWEQSFFSPPCQEQFLTSLPLAFLRAVENWPNRTAVLVGGKSFSFYDLALRIAGLADEINNAVTKPGPIALVQSLGIDAVAAWFACTLAGRAFMLLDPNDPPARLHELIASARCPLVLVDRGMLPALTGFSQSNLLIPNCRMGTFSVGPKSLCAQDLAMIFPTSGSTGEPKLIAYSSSTLLLKVKSSILLMEIPENACAVIATSHSNYGFLHHALVFLLSGGTLCLSDIRSAGFPALVDAIILHGARHARFTPSTFRVFASLPEAQEALKRLDAIRFSGEPLLSTDLELAKTVLRNDCLIQNIYGSTESALFIWSNRDSKMPANEPTVPIGKIYPLAAYALTPLQDDDDNENVGELVIKSTFHALGDLSNGAIDQSRFPEIQGSDHERLYKTGDVVRRLPDGNLVHLGRRGRIVKIRGHRVSLTEVENHLRSMPGVTNATVLERNERDGCVLYGFITCLASTSLSKVFFVLAERLPQHMLPRQIITTENIPLLSGGKVDHQALLAMLPSITTRAEITSGKSTELQLLIQIWDHVLWLGAHEHKKTFQQLGGDSLKLMTLSLEIERAFNKELQMQEFLANGTLDNLVAVLGIDRDYQHE